MNKSITVDDFFTGLFAALTLKDREGASYSIRNERFDQAVELVFRYLCDHAEENGLDLRFRIRRHQLHQDSAIVRDAIYAAAGRDLVSLENPEYQDLRLKLSKNQASKLLDSRFREERNLFLHLADEFVGHYAGTAA